MQALSLAKEHGLLRMLLGLCPSSLVGQSGHLEDSRRAQVSIVWGWEVSPPQSNAVGLVRLIGLMYETPSIIKANISLVPPPSGALVS